jgi:surface protein
MFHLKPIKTIVIRLLVSFAALASCHEAHLDSSDLESRVLRKLKPASKKSSKSPKSSAAIGGRYNEGGRGPSVHGKEESATRRLAPLVCKNWCYNNDKGWDIKCGWVNCNGCDECPKKTEKKKKDTKSDKARKKFRKALGCKSGLAKLPPNGMQGIVSDCLSLGDPYTCTYGWPIGCWDTSLVENMDRAFYAKNNDSGQATFNLPIDGWDTSSCTSMQEMFNYADAFNQDIGSWDVSKVSYMNGMFSYAKAFNQDIGDWDVSKVTVMQSMFFRAEGFNQDIGDWDVSKVTNMRNMFRNAESFNQCLSSWGNEASNSLDGVGVANMFTDSDCTDKADPDFPFDNTITNKWCSC